MADSRFSTGGTYTRIEHGWKWHTEQGTHYLFDNGDSAIADDRAAVDPLCVLQGQIEALEKRCTDLGHKADGAHTRVGAQQGQVDALRKHLNQLITILGYEIGDYGRVQLKRQEASIKRIIEGGWVNFYPEGGWGPDGPHATKHKADCQAGTGRIACIQIPDITEGEGL